MNLRLVVLLTVLVHLAFAGCRVTLSLFAISLEASPITVGALGAARGMMPVFWTMAIALVTGAYYARRP